MTHVIFIELLMLAIILGVGVIYVILVKKFDTDGGIFGIIFAAALLGALVVTVVFYRTISR